MKIERKDLLILVAAALFGFVSVPGVIFNSAVKKYLNFLGFWAEKPSSSIKKVYISDLPAAKKRSVSKGDLAQPELKIVPFSVKLNSVSEITLAGDFNKWSPVSIKLVKMSNSFWETMVPLSPGTYHYIYYADGKKILDPGNPSVEMRDGEKVSVIRVK